MGSIFTVIASIIAAVASIVATVMVWYQGKKNRKLTSIINYKINCLDLTTKIISEYITTIWKSVELNAKYRAESITQDELKEQMDVSQKLMSLTFEINFNINYNNEMSSMLGDALNEISTEKAELFSLEDKEYFEADHSLENSVNNLTISVKTYVDEEWRLINKEL